MTGTDPLPRRGNLGATHHGQCRIVWTGDRIDSIKAGTAIPVQVGAEGQILPCYVIAKLPQRVDADGRSHQAVARCGIIEDLLIPGEQFARPEPPTSSESQPPT